MAKTITIKLSGLAEKFINELRHEGLSEADVISQSIGLLEQVWRTNRVALIRKEYFQESQSGELKERYSDERIIEFYYHLQTPREMKKRDFDNDFSKL